MKLLLTFTSIILLTYNSFAQYCGSGSFQYTLTPSTTTQTTSAVSSGKPYYRFNAVAGCMYTFSTCNLSTIDTYLSLYSGSALSTGILYNDDNCGLQSTINWVCPTSGVYSILITRWTSSSDCNNLNNDVRMLYYVSCPYTSSLTIPTSGSNTINCNNTTLYDNGGLLNYSNNNTGYTVINSIGNSINISGLYNTENFYDKILIYDGIGISGSLLATYTGNGFINFNNTFGQTITIQFITDNSVNYFGFQLNITYNQLCNILPIELISFKVVNDNNQNLLLWSTATETNNKGFTIQRSIDAYNWSNISFKNGHNNSLETLYYTYIDNTYDYTLNYYRLEQVDFDGATTKSNVIDIDNSKEGTLNVNKIINLIGQEVNNNYKGSVIIYYSNGTYKFKLNN